MTRHQEIVITLHIAEWMDTSWVHYIPLPSSFLWNQCHCMCCRGFKENTAAQLFYPPQALPVIEHTALSQVFILWLHFWVCATVCHCVPWGLHCFFIKPSSSRNLPQLHPAHIPQLSLPRKRRGERPVNAKVLLAPVRSWDAAKDRPTGS